MMVPSKGSAQGSSSAPDSKERPVIQPKRSGNSESSESSEARSMSKPIIKRSTSDALVYKKPRWPPAHKQQEPFLNRPYVLPQKAGDAQANQWQQHGGYR